MRAMTRRRWIAGLTAAVLCLPAGTAWHELVGHGLTGILAGGRITSADVLFVQVWPSLRLHGWTEQYGHCEVAGVPTRTGELLMELGGSMSTLAASVAALVLLRVRRWGPVGRAALLAVGVWWVDLLTYTLPTWGIRRSILWGGLYAEPYEAAVGLGMSGWLFQTLVLVGSGVLAGCWVIMLVQRGVVQSGGPRGLEPGAR